MSGSTGIHVRHCHVENASKKSEETEMVRQLRARIKLNGPITVADYMREVLTNPVAVGIIIEIELKILALDRSVFQQINASTVIGHNLMSDTSGLLHES